ncbi:MAG: hypothetical protein HYR56_29260 [Acidobacteria bacterium]|nr:hypothetical protein [Acidobacteriota bacterium]MBI3425477.1 hypothetical protein [Acidobacteriota bacterium]
MAVAEIPALALEPAVLNAVIVPLQRPDDAQSRVLQLSNVVFKTPPKPGGTVTILALSSALPALEARITNAKLVENPCSESLPKQWEIEFEPLTQAAYVDAVLAVPGRIEGSYAPFQVCVIYPANPQARALNRGLLNAADLPKGAALPNVIMALDLNGDQSPDLIATEYCCDKPKEGREHCDLTCGKTYLRAAGRWKQIDASTPC